MEGAEREERVTQTSEPADDCRFPGIITSPEVTAWSTEESAASYTQ